MHAKDLTMLWSFLLLSVTSVVFSTVEGDTSHSAGRAKREISPGKLRIVTVPHDPYVFIKQDSNGKSFTGFLPDLIYSMSRIMRFDYEFYESPDGRYGAADSDGNWNGMIGEVQKRRYSENGTVLGDYEDGADMAAADLTVTPKRHEVVDFVKPFHSLGLTLAVQKAYVNKTETQWPFDFSVLKPLQAEVWGLLILSVIVVGLILWGMNHFNPYEWGGRYNLGLANEHQKDSFGVAGSLWFVFSTLQWQGFERAPRSIASKVLTCFWFAFVTMFLVTYTGSLVNYLFWASVVHGGSPAKHPILDLKDLVMGGGKDFKYGCVGGGSTYAYITQVAAPKWPEFNRMKEYWESDEGRDQIVSSSREGYAKVREGNYVFIAESMSVKYEMNKAPCDLTTIGTQFGLRSYGMALPLGSPFLKALDQALLTLQSLGELDALEEKWWTGKGECWNATQVDRRLEKISQLYVNKPKQVNLTMFWGPLVLLLVGVLLSLIIGVAEFFFYKYKGRDMKERLTASGEQKTPGNFDA